MILLLSGPNLNLLGTREPDDLRLRHARRLRRRRPRGRRGARATRSSTSSRTTKASSSTRSRARAGRCAAIVINPGALTHSSYALADALAAYDGVKVELHLSNPSSREEWRRRSVVAPYVTGTVAGFGRTGYRLAVEAVVETLEGS